MIIGLPSLNELPKYFDRYINLVFTDDLIAGLEEEMQDTIETTLGLSTDLLEFKYAEGKWNMKEILMHIVDTERIFNYRALRFARYDDTELSGFDDNAYAIASKADQRTIQSILDEYESVRNSSIQLFSNFTRDMLNQKGIANGVEISVRALGFTILGHEMHHKKIFEERYIKAFN